MVDINLNLARKWRTKSFDQIVGQDLPVRMLKNSLYLNQLFPVYLFSGQHGCGKTSTARIFAAAINCEKLFLFQKDPKNNSLPCLECASCVAMRLGKHLDFIEIDAASHTGVDNMRAIIDTAALMPLSSRKKIYLIDEAHMLSKAAFNALLKILEEPPSATLFILATTDPQKIIDTVKSRCFQLFFKAVETQTLVTYLKTICKSELINYDQQGLELIVRETHGSVRDALNVIEQFRFSSGVITHECVAQVLGHIDTQCLIEILTLIFTGKAKELLLFLQRTHLETFSAEFIWDRIIEILRALLWHRHGVQVESTVDYVQYLEALARHCSIDDVQAALFLLYTHETAFLKTTKQHIFLEILFLQLCMHKNSNQSGSANGMAEKALSMDKALDAGDYVSEDTVQEIEPTQQLSDSLLVRWQQFVVLIEQDQDPLLVSIFSQCSCVAFNEVSGVLDIEIPKKFGFFESIVHEQRDTWMPHLKKLFSPTVNLNFIFIKTDEVVNHQAIKKIRSASADVDTSRAIDSSATDTKLSDKKGEVGFETLNVRKSVSNAHESIHNNQFSKKIDISDADNWKTTHMILQHFPGSVWQLGD